MTISKTGCVEVSGGRVLCRTGLLGLEGPSRERLKTAMNAANQPQLEECLSALGPRRGMAPEIWGWRVSQGYHLQGGQRPPGRSHVLFLSEQPQKDVFFILRPAVDMSVLEPGGHMLLWEREWREQRPLEKNLDSRSPSSQTSMAFPSGVFPTKRSWVLRYFAFGRG